MAVLRGCVVTVSVIVASITVNEGTITIFDFAILVPVTRYGIAVMQIPVPGYAPAVLHIQFFMGESDMYLNGQHIGDLLRLPLPRPPRSVYVAVITYPNPRPGVRHNKSGGRRPPLRNRAHRLYTRVAVCPLYNWRTALCRKWRCALLCIVCCSMYRTLGYAHDWADRTDTHANYATFTIERTSVLRCADCQ